MLFELSLEFNYHELNLQEHSSRAKWRSTIPRQFDLVITISLAGGLTSGWFCLESSVLTLAISAAAFAFYQDRTKQKARRMFRASLLYLPVFMSGLIFHRITDNEQDLVQDNTEKMIVEEESENVRSEKARWNAGGNQAKSPVAYASVAPFPFLPAPIYSAN